MLNINLTFVQCIHTSTVRFDDSWMDNFNMVTLSMEPRKQIITLHNKSTITVSPLIQSAIGISLDSRDTAAASKPNVARVIPILKCDQI